MFEGRSARLFVVLIAIVWAVIVLRSVMNAKDPGDFVVTVSQQEVTRYARQQLREIQPRSIAENTELCGMIFEDRDGNLQTTRLLVGDHESCDISYFDEPGMAPVASYHTHAAFGRNYDGEVPSLTDFNSDVATGLDGYVSTPGGRFWHIDVERDAAMQICGVGCLPKDPAFELCRNDQPASSYSFAELKARFEDRSRRC